MKVRYLLGLALLGVMTTAGVEAQEIPEICTFDYVISRHKEYRRICSLGGPTEEEFSSCVCLYAESEFNKTLDTCYPLILTSKKADFALLSAMHLYKTICNKTDEINLYDRYHERNPVTAEETELEDLFQTY